LTIIAMVDMHFVRSRSIDSIGYDPDSSELYVKFVHAPTVYVYRDVPREVFARLMSAPSKGQFVNLEVKPVYSFHRA
jgi:hypothetical protein